jgi:hypothetical protein
MWYNRDEFVENDYVLVFLAAPAVYRPPWLWLLKAYRALDRRYTLCCRKQIMAIRTSITLP